MDNAGSENSQLMSCAAATTNFEVTEANSSLSKLSYVCSRNWSQRD